MGYNKFGKLNRKLGRKKREDVVNYILSKNIHYLRNLYFITYLQVLQSSLSFVGLQKTTGIYYLNIYAWLFTHNSMVCNA